MKINTTYNPATGLVRIALFREDSTNGRRHKTHAGEIRIPRERIRRLCDQLHDLADRIDADGEGASQSLPPSTTGHLSGSGSSLPDLVFTHRSRHGS